MLMLKFGELQTPEINVNDIESSIPILQETYWASNKNFSSLMVQNHCREHRMKYLRSTV